MKQIIMTLAMVALLAVTGLAGSNMTINGAGASFPYPVYSQWAYKYNKLTGVKVNYQSIGSGGGIAQIKAKTVDFGASDAPLEKDELDESGLIQFPMIIGGVVPVVNVPGISAGQLKITPDVLVGMFMDKVKKWNDPAIAKLNPGVKLPDMAVTVVHRADGSGTTWIFTNYLSQVSSEWNKNIGTGKAVKWPKGVAGKGNEGVANYVKQAPGSIGYVEYAYALQNKLAYVLLRNKAGKFVAPTNETFQSAAANADWKNAPGYYMVLTDQPGDDSWPITGASFILVHKDLGKATKAKGMLKFFDWCYNHGGEMAEKLDYVPIPKSVVDLVEETWKSELKAGGKPVWP